MIALTLSGRPSCHHPVGVAEACVVVSKISARGTPRPEGHFLQSDEGTARRDPVDATMLLTRDLELRAGNSGGLIIVWKGDKAEVVCIVSTQLAATAVKDRLDWILPGSRATTPSSPAPPRSTPTG